MKVELNNFSNILFGFQWQFSRVCNKKCFYCTTQNEKSFSRNIYKLSKYEEIEYQFLMDELTFFFKKLNIERGFLNLFGGEPFLHPKFNETVIYFTNFFNKIKSKDFYLFITTNGTLLNNLLDLNIDNKNKIFLSISYHYFNTKIDKFIDQVKAIHNKFNYTISSVIPDKINTNKKTYEKYKKNIQRIIDNGLNIEFKYQLNPLTLETNPTEKTDEFINLNKYSLKNSFFKDIGKNILKIDNKIFNLSPDIFFQGFPVFKNNVCYNFQPGLFYLNKELYFGFSCNEGKMIKIKDLMNNQIKIFDFFKKNYKINCTRKICTELRHKTNPLKMFSNDPKEINKIKNLLRKL